jgi:hypothetical protein
VELDISEFDRVVRKQKQNKSTTSSMPYYGVTAETDNEIFKLWNNYFSDLYNISILLFPPTPFSSTFPLSKLGLI